MRNVRSWAFAALLMGAAGCGEDGEAEGARWLDAPTDTLPARLSEMGLYPEAGRIDLTHPRAIGYTPRWPLWTNGGDKTRYVILPEGESVGAGGDVWAMPEGALLIKTFAFKRSPEGAPVPIETRVMRKTAEGWLYDGYIWDEDGQDATLRDSRRSALVQVYDADGQPFEHRIPNQLDCKSCHASEPGEVLGFSGRQLDEGDLQRLAEGGVLDQAPEPYTLPLSGLDGEVAAYFVANCAFCHNGGSGVSNAFDLRPEVMLENTINTPTEGSGSAVGLRVVPGAPSESVLFQAVSGEGGGDELKLMPPDDLVQLRDAEGIETLRRWIETMEP